ncbi:hypothetical protein [Prochlorococcus sp. MIT 0916]|uniref:hypothetical protein n=1 Tax=Prochlorococcus sp. MIT 0916 TaxID=3082521 RepID=UPI0039B6B6E7
MRHSLITKSLVFVFLNPLIINSVLSKNIDNHLLINQLEVFLNQRKDDLLKELFLQKSFNQFNKQYLAFRHKYKDAKWSIQPVSNDQNKSMLDIKIRSTREINDQIYNLYTKQTVKLETYKDKIKGYEVIDEESILHSKNSPLSIKIVSPKKVLTGEKYEINLIIENPLDNSLTASGMIVLKNEDDKKISNDIFGIKPNQSGGLFKYIQAPFKPGSQTISAIITHPKGIYLITKKIKVGL